MTIHAASPSRSLLALVSAFALLLGGAAPLEAQSSYVVPNTMTSVEGRSFTSFPFGRSTPVRLQLAYAAELFLPRSMTIRRIAFRPDGGRALAAKGIDLEIHASAIAPAAALGSSFAANRGSGHASVFARRRLSLPAIVSAAGPRAFGVEFVLDRSFALDPTSSGLLIEFIVHAQQAGRYELDLDASCISARANFGRPGCAGSNQLVPVADCPTSALELGKAFTLRVARLRPQDLALGYLGTKETGTWQGLALPAALDIFGARGCTLNTDVAVSVGGLVDVRGELRLPGVVPTTPSLVGAWLRFQGLGLDAPANALGMAFSQGFKIQVCTRPPMRRCVSTNLSAVTGSVDAGLVPVTRFRD